MDTNLDTLATALYVTTDDMLTAHPEQVPLRPRIGIAPRTSDAEMLTLAVMQVLLGYTSEARWLRYARSNLAGMFPSLPGQFGYNKRLRKLAGTMAWLIGQLRSVPAGRGQSDALQRSAGQSGEALQDGHGSAAGSSGRLQGALKGCTVVSSVTSMSPVTLGVLMHVLETANIPSEQLEALDNFARSNAGPELRDLLLSLSRCVRDGDEVVVIDDDATVTPNQASERLGMSRTHLYKLLDQGEIVFHRVGRDRRIRVSDLIEFEKQHQRARRELAERFAHQRQTSAAADSEIADLL